MLKSILFRLWLMGFAALIAMLTPGAAVAEPIIVIIGSQHNLEYARRACSSVANPEGIAECNFVGDGRNLGRKLENEVRSRITTNARCQGVDVFRQNHPDYDGTNPPVSRRVDRPDFHCGQGHADNFARKGVEIADRPRRLGRRQRRSAGRLWASSRGWEADLPPSPGEALTPSEKRGPPPSRPPWFFTS